MWIGHRKEIRKLTFRALALRRLADKDGPATRVEVWVNQDVFDAGLVLAGKSNKEREKTLHVYRIDSNQTINPAVNIC